MFEYTNYAASSAMPTPADKFKRDLPDLSGEIVHDSPTLLGLPLVRSESPVSVRSGSPNSLIQIVDPVTATDSQNLHCDTPPRSPSLQPTDAVSRSDSDAPLAYTQPYCSDQPLAAPNVGQNDQSIDGRKFALAIDSMSNRPGFYSLEWDHFDIQNITTLVNAVIDYQSNTIELLNRLNLLAYTGEQVSLPMPAETY